MKRLLEMKKIPTTRDNYIGVEIEFLLLPKHYDKLMNALLKEGVEYNVNVGSDRSVIDLDFVAVYAERNYNGYVDTTVTNINHKFAGMEIRVLATEKELTNVIKKTCKVIKSCGGKVNTTCGLHVHMDMRNRVFETVFNNFYFSQKFLFSTQPKQRMVGKYSKLLRSATTNPTTRYYGVNKLAFKEHKTLEIRMHEGSIDEKEILLWVGTLIKIADLSDKLSKQIKKPDVLKLPSKVQEYFDERIKRYARNENSKAPKVISLAG